MNTRELPLQQEYEQLFQIRKDERCHGHQNLRLKADRVVSIQSANRRREIALASPRIVALLHSIQAHTDFIRQAHQFPREFFRHEMAVRVEAAVNPVLRIGRFEIPQQIREIRPQERLSPGEEDVFAVPMPPVPARYERIPLGSIPPAAAASRRNSSRRSADCTPSSHENRPCESGSSEEADLRRGEVLL